MGAGYKYDSEYGEGRYTYDTYQGSGEVRNNAEINGGTNLNEYNPDFTNSEIRDSLGAGSGEHDSLAKDAGVDLNAGANISNKGRIETKQDSLGENLNDYEVDAVLDNFKENKWSDLSLEEQKQSITDLANYVAVDTGNKNPPEVIFSNDMPDGSYGGYNPETNTIEINENMLDDSAEAADTIAHEMWHAYQQQEASDPTSPKGQEYQEGFDNYISPEYDFEGYENQMVEAEARDYAQGFKDRLKGAA